MEADVDGLAGIVDGQFDVGPARLGALGFQDEHLRLERTENPLRLLLGHDGSLTNGTVEGAGDKRHLDWGLLRQNVLVRGEPTLDQTTVDRRLASLEEGLVRPQRDSYQVGRVRK